MRLLVLCMVVLLAVASQATLLNMYQSGCPSGTSAFTVDVTAGKCYTLPRSGSCNTNTNPGCAQVLTASNRDLAALIGTANCTTFSNSFIIGAGTLRYFSSANCTGLESNGPLNNPCLTVSLCNATSMSTGSFQASTSAAANLVAALLTF